jgi:hypothetical protein
MERARFDAEAEVTEDFRPVPIAQTHIGELDHSGVVSESAGADNSPEPLNLPIARNMGKFEET